MDNLLDRVITWTFLGIGLLSVAMVIQAIAEFNEIDLTKLF